MIDLTVNGVGCSVHVQPDTPLLWVIRDHLKFTGTKFGCGAEICGVCAVRLDDMLVRSCSVPIARAAGKVVTTIEGIGGCVIEALRAAWLELNVSQCGYCQPGQLMAAAFLLERNANPSNREIDEIMNGILCRCGTYQRIRRGIHCAARKLESAMSGRF
jgi:isoquinoline 1-oxidoreductase subunit alpha